MKDIARLYIPVYINDKVSLINANKVPLLKEVLPDKETLLTHLLLQKAKLEKDKKYKPQPFEIQLELSIFNEIIKEVHKKNCKAPNDHIALQFQSKGLPVCIIKVRE